MAASFAPLLTDSLAIVLAFLIAGSLPAWALAGLNAASPAGLSGAFGGLVLIYLGYSGLKKKIDLVQPAKASVRACGRPCW